VKVNDNSISHDCWMICCPLHCSRMIMMSAVADRTHAAPLVDRRN
jgi:hypothetical protein